MGCCLSDQGDGATEAKTAGSRTKRTSAYILQLDEAWKDEDTEMFEVELGELSGQLPSRFNLQQEEDIVASLSSRDKIQIQFS